MNRPVPLALVIVILTIVLGISTFIVNQAAQDAASAAREAAKAARIAKSDVVKHRQSSERQLTEVTKFIECSLLTSPEVRTVELLEMCAKKAGINP